VFGDTAVINEWLLRSDKYERVGELVTDANYFGRGYGIAVNRQDVALRDKLNMALDEIVANGTYDKIHTRWFN